mmetsp:Transcript_7828/g.27842  ORF Transcript_7828/g.27842 Transcript_7828/m.27842 type:complete len:365 (+) Transcript_7828:2-1096(+)
MSTSSSSSLTSSTAAAAAGAAAPRADIWLAVEETNKAARQLYARIGYAAVDGEMEIRRGHVLLQKTVAAAPAAAEISAAERGSASTFDVLAPAPASLADFVAPHVLFSLVAVLGISALVSPLAYAGASPSPPVALLGDIFDARHCLPDAALAAGAAFAAERYRLARAARKAPVDVLEELRADASLVAQKRALWRLTGGGAGSPARAVAVVGAWQLAAALGEELYYRGLVHGGAARALGHVFDGAPFSLAAALPYESVALPLRLVADGGALAVSTALFAAAHTLWVDDDDPGAAEKKADWIEQTAPFGALLGLLFATTNHRLLAPVLTHAFLNTYWCALDLAELRKVPRQDLAQIFDEADAPAAS